MLKEAAGFIEGLRPGSSPRRTISRSFRAVPELLAFVNEVFGEIGVGARRTDDFSYDQTDRFPLTDSPGDEGRRPSALALGIVAGAEHEDCARRGRSRDRATASRCDGSRPAHRPGPCGNGRGYRHPLPVTRQPPRVRSRARGARHPAYVYKGLGFFDADEIQDLSALIRYLADPRSDLRAASFLRSRVVRLSDAGLAALAPNLADAITGDLPEAVAGLEEDDRRALLLARSSVPAWLAAVDRIPPADLIEQILPEVAYAYELRGARAAQAWENVKKMRGLIRRIQNRGYATLARIADHLDALTAGDESNAVLEALDAVNLMTIHAAKGLEFPIVFVVNLSKGATGIPKPMRVSGEDVAVGPFVSETDEDEKTREREETKRLLYVALTRARDRLYLASALKDGTIHAGRGSLAEVLPASICAAFSAAAAGSGDSIDWMAPSGRTYRFRICRTAAGVSG